MTQEERVIEYMQQNGSITALDALRDLGVMRLASRISDLKKRGYTISSCMEKGKNKFGETVMYKRYSLTTLPSAIEEYYGSDYLS